MTKHDNKAACHFVLQDDKTEYCHDLLATFQLLLLNLSECWQNVWLHDSLFNI